MIFPIALALVGLVLLIRAADVFVHGAARLAKALNISAIVIGVVVIGFGTSAPELLVSSLAASRGHPEIAAGNIIGSNVANLTLVLGLIAVAFTPVIKAQTLRREAPLSAAAVVLFALLVQGELNRADGVILLVALGGALALMFASSKSKDLVLANEVDQFLESGTISTRREALRTLVGLLGTLAGAHLLVEAATDIAGRLGASEGFVGFTLVALGTTMPEIVTGFHAARNGETDLVIGNLLGSNMFNALAVGGAAALFGPGAIADTNLTTTATVLMVVVALGVLLLMRTGHRLHRWEGIVLIGLYAVSMPLVSG